MTLLVQAFTLKNSAGLKLVGEVLRNPKNNGVAVVMHGIGAYSHEPLIQTLVDSAYSTGMTVVRFDTTHSFGESEGRLSAMRFSTYADDLHCVMNWIQEQSWGKAPHTLIGHSLGAACCLDYAAQHPHDVLRLVLVSCVVGGAWWLKAHQDAIPDTLKAWQRDGVLPKTHPIRKELSGEVSWSYAEDIQQRDFIKTAAPRVTCPALLVVGSIDPITPVAAQRDLQKALGAESELHVIQGCGHTFKSNSQQQELRETITNWLPSLGG